MPDLPPSVSQSLVLFLLVAAGFAAGKAGILKGATISSLSRFLLDFTLPALVLVSMQQPFSPALRDQAYRVLALSLLIYASSFPLAYGLSAFYKKASRDEKGVHRFAMCFSNVGFMGFPVAESVLGRDSLFIVAIYNIPFQVLAFSVGVVLIRGLGAVNSPAAPRSLRSALASSAKALFNPAVAAAFIGFILFLSSSRIPDPFYAAFELLGGTTTPLAMVLIGAILSGTKLGPVFANPRLWITVLYRLALHPLIVFFIAGAFGLSGMELAVPVLIAAMPVAANTTILAGVYGGDLATSSGLVFMSTLLSLVSIPLLSYLF